MPRSRCVREIGDWESGGGLSGVTRAQAGPLFVELFKLQEATLGKLDFNARRHRLNSEMCRDVPVGGA